jgi:hypothetical protein
MIGHVIMEIEYDEMRAALAYYFNRDVFNVYAGRERHQAVITDVRQRSNGNFVVEFKGWQPPIVRKETPDGANDIS